MDSFGTSLKRERERRKISLEEIAASTKISTRMLTALEQEHFELLPGGIFNRGFVRAYARFLGMDEDKAVADYLKTAGESVPVPETDKPEVKAAAPVARLKAKAPRRKNQADVPWSVLVLALVIVAVTVALWWNRVLGPVGSHSRHYPSTTRHVAVVPSRKPDVLAKPVPASPVTGQDAELQQVASHEVLKDEASGSSPLLEVKAKPPSTAQGDGFQLRIKATQDCWLTITRDGKQIFQGALTAGSEQSLRARERLLVKAGNAGALELHFNGKKIPFQGEVGQVKLLSFGVNGLDPSGGDTPQP